MSQSEIDVNLRGRRLGANVLQFGISVDSRSRDPYFERKGKFIV